MKMNYFSCDIRRTKVIKMFFKIIIFIIVLNQAIFKAKVICASEDDRIKFEDNFKIKSENGVQTAQKNNLDTLESQNLLNLIMERRITASLKLTMRNIQAEICSKLVSVVFKKYDFMYIYSIKEEDSGWLEMYMKVIQNKDRFTIKYSTINSNDVYQTVIKEIPKEKPMARKKLDIILLYIENILEGENILKMWTKQFGSHEGDDYVLIITKESSKSYADKFLRRMWQYFKLFNVFIIDINEFKHEKIQSTVQFYLHNPYRKVGENFQEYEFNETDIDEKSRLIFQDIELRIMDLNGYPLKVKINDFTGLTGPILDKNNKIIGFKGKVGKVVEEYAKVMNFTPVYVTHKNFENNESSLETSTTPIPSTDYSDENIDLYGNYKIVLYDPTSNVRYLKTLQQVRVVIVVPSAIPKCRSIGTPLETLDQWGRVFALAFLSFLIILWTIVRTKISSKCCSIWNNFLIVFMNCIRITHFSTIRMPDSKWEKFIFIILTVWIFFIGNSFTGTIVTRLAVTNSHEINTLKDLAESDFMIANMNNTQRVLIRGLSNMNSEEAEIRKKLFKRQFLIYDPAGIWEISAHKRTFAVICPEYIARAVVEQYYDKNDGRDLLHEMKETVSMMYSAQVIPKSSPLAKSFEYVQDIIFQAGFLQYWQAEEDYLVTVKKMHRITESESGQRKLNLENLQNTFNVWALMLAVATIVFLIELLISEASSDNINSMF